MAAAQIHKDRRRYLFRSAIQIAAACAFSATFLFSQWTQYPARNVPKLPDGSPNLNAPAPRAPDGKPDFSGLWEPKRQRIVETTEALQTRKSQFWDIWSGIPGGLPYQPWAKQLRDRRESENSRDNPDVLCLPIGILQMHTHPFPRRIVQAPGLIAILHERNSEYRQIFTDGRPLPVDPNPSWNGYSSGKWEGDTLVVQSNGFRDDLWADYNGSPLTAESKLTERIRRPTFGTIEIEATVDDPKAYTKPWTVNLALSLILDTEMIEYVCQENEKDAKHMVGK
jgi:hypothetical protein